MRTLRLGLIVNPIAGMGGAVGLKGSDGRIRQAEALGARPVAAERARLALLALRSSVSDVALLTVAGAMGEEVAREAGFTPRIVSRPVDSVTTALDTRSAARALADQGVELLLFAGGDGTARDVWQAVGDDVVMLGIPAGVKMHSAVFAVGPRQAGELAARFLAGDQKVTVEMGEIMDREEATLSARLFGFARVPRAPRFVQRAKAIPAVSDEAALDAACRQVASLCQDERLTILGPGNTLQRIKHLLGFEGTLDGVDLVAGGQLLARDQNEAQILAALEGREGRIVVSIIGGQGYVFGRGNQQISAAVIRKIGKENILIVAARDKLLSLPESCLFVDTGDGELDRQLAGYVPVLTSAHEKLMFRIAG